jgi:hypothetical protein
MYIPPFPPRKFINIAFKTFACFPTDAKFIERAHTHTHVSIFTSASWDRWAIARMACERPTKRTQYYVI